MEPKEPAGRVAPRTPSNARGKRPRRWVPWLGALIVTALVVVGLWPKPAPVETEKVTTGSLRATVSEEGKTRIRHRYMVSAPVPGQLRRIEFKPGAEVTAGETIVAVIDPLAPSMLDARTRALAQARRDTAAANLERARAANRFAKSELDRFTKLFEDRTIAVQEFEQAQWRETSAAKELAATEAALRQAEAELAEFIGPFAPNADGHSRSLKNAEDADAKGGSENGERPRASHDVKAPASGRVLRVLEESARTVTAGTPLMEIGDPADLEVVIEVLSRDGAVIQPGTHVELEQWGGNKPLHARVRLVEPAAFTKVSALGVEEQRVNVIADVVTPPSQRAALGDQFRVEARIVTWESNNVVKVASGAVFRRGEQAGVFLVRNGRAAYQPITAGRSSGREIEVVDGLSLGDEVIVYPGDRISDGQRVKPLTIKR